MRVLLQRLLFLSLASGVLAGGGYLTTDAFSARWRGFIVDQLAERGIHMDLGRVSLNPVGGLVARDVKWYNDEDRKHLVASVDRVNLDFDYGQLLNKKVEVESLELSRAHVSLPIDPEQPELTVVNVDDLSARIFLEGNQLEVRHAEGTLAGVRLSLSGTMQMKKPPTDPKEREKAREAARKRLAMIREHRQQIQKTLDWLDQFQFSSPPELRVEVSGSMEEVDQFRAKLTFLAQKMMFQDYVCEEFSVEGRYDAGLVDLKRLYLKDHLGDVTLHAFWRQGGESLNFELASSADLPHLASTFLKSDLLKEVVFYEAPHLALEGKWFTSGERAKSSRPVEAVGKLQSGRFSSRGEIFDGLGFEIGVGPEGLYLRDVELEHKTGTLKAQALLHETQGLKYRATLEMDPHVFLPFIEREQTRAVIHRFGFRPESSIYVAVEGSGPTMQFSDCRSQGMGELKNFTYQGVDLVSFGADVEFFKKIMIFTNVEVEREEGTGAATEVYVDDGDDWVRLTGVATKLDTVAVISAFNAKTAATVAKYRLPNTTEVTLDGVIGWKNSDYNEFTVNFTADGGTGIYELWDEDYVISSPSGTLKFKDTSLDLDIRGSAFRMPMRATGTVSIAKDNSDYKITVSTGTFPYEVFGEKLDFNEMTAKVASRSGDLTFDIDATLMDGSFDLSGKMDMDRRPEPYSGEMKINAMSFQKFSETYTPDYPTEGDLTGHFKFTGVNNDWQKLKGGGAAIVVNGNLYAVPLLGPLTPLLGAFLPKPIQGYNVAKEASCTFEVTDGFVVTKDMEAETSVFRIVAGGTADFIHDEIDFKAQARVRGIGGLVFFPVSQLLEYQANGTIGDPKWSPTLLGLNTIGKGRNRETPSMEALKEAEEIGANDSLPPQADEPPKKKFLLPFFRGMSK